MIEWANEVFEDGLYNLLRVALMDDCNKISALEWASSRFLEYLDLGGEEYEEFCEEAIERINRYLEEER